MVLDPGELRSYFTDWDILVYEEGVEPSKKAEPWPVSSPENPHERKITHAPNRGLTNEAIKL